MAYDYLGTMDRDQFNDLVLFARKQKTLGVWQEDHAKAEIKRNDCFLVKMLKAHDVFFSGSLGVEQSLPELKDRSLDGIRSTTGDSAADGLRVLGEDIVCKGPPPVRIPFPKEGEPGKIINIDLCSPEGLCLLGGGLSCDEPEEPD